jgi:GT2 family glycosyltransferase
MRRISIVLPAYFSHATLGRCLAAIAAQSRRPEETIVVNSSPDADTAPVVAGFPWVRLIQSPTRLLPHAARNRGLAEATGDVLVCSDPDVVADPRWLQELEAAIGAGHPFVGGAMSMQPHPPAQTRVAQAIHLTKFWWALPAGIERSTWIVPTANCAFTRPLWEQIGPFPENVFCGDAVFSWKAARTGSAPRFLPQAIVNHEHDETVAMMRTQRFRRGVEFGRERARWEGWSPARRWSQAFASPLRTMAVLHHARKAAHAAGWGDAFRNSVSLQALFQAAWTTGEARGWMQA